MSLLFSLALLVPAGAGDDPLRPDTLPGLQPDTLLRLEGGPSIHLVRTPGSPTVAVRLSLPLEERPGEAGAARLLQAMVRDRITDQAARIGARIEVTRTSRVGVYAVRGSSADFDHLAWLLREAVAPPSADESAFQAARSSALTELRRGAETGEGALISRLRERISPGAASDRQARASLETLTLEELRDYWARTFVTDRMRLVVAADLPPEVVLVSFQGLAAVAGTLSEASPPPSAPDPREERPEVLRTWYGEGYTFQDPLDPAPAVIARLLGERVRQAPGPYELSVHLWQADGGWAVTLSGAAYPRDVGEVRERIRNLPREVSAGVTPAAVQETASRMRLSLLTDARTPGGLVGAVGRFLDLTGEPDGFRRYVDALDRLSPAAVEAELSAMVEASPIQVEIRP